MVLTSDREDPVLAKWQYGLGRVIAWTADNGSDLAAPWAMWEGYDEFWAAAVRWALPDPERRPLTVSTHRDGADMVLTVTAAGESGDFADFLPTFATVTSASGETGRDPGADADGPRRVHAAPAGPGSRRLRRRGAAGTGERPAGRGGGHHRASVTRDASRPGRPFPPRLARRPHERPRPLARRSGRASGMPRPPVAVPCASIAPSGTSPSAWRWRSS